MQRSMFVLVLAVTGCRFDGSGVAFDQDAADVPPPPPDAPVDAAFDARPDATVDASFDATTQVRCPLNYARLSDRVSAHRLGNDKLDWEDAEADCASDGPGIHLVVLDDAQELADVSSLIGDDKGWIGVSARNRPWLTVTGAAPPLLPWRPGEPDNVDGSSDEECVELVGKDRQINDTECSGRRRYVCECDGVAPDPSAF